MYEVPGERLREMTANIDELSRQKDGAYAERDQLVSALTKLFPSHLARHKETPGEQWGEEWLNIVCIHLPTGQVTWHIHISELTWFSHLNRVTIQCDGYDHSTTPEKYQRLFRLPVMWMPWLDVNDLGSL